MIVLTRTSGKTSQIQKAPVYLNCPSPDRQLIGLSVRENVKEQRPRGSALERWTSHPLPSWFHDFTAHSDLKRFLHVLEAQQVATG